MKFLRKYFYLSLLVIVTIPLLCLIIMLNDDSNNLCFNIRLDAGNSYTVEAYRNKTLLYLFIPGNVKLDDVTLASPEATIDGQVYRAGDSINGIALEEKHQIYFENKKYSLNIYQGSEIATLYLKTAAGNMREVYTDRDHREPISLMAYDKDGKADYQDKTAYIKGRGNTTWTWSWAKKKPFNLIFDEEVSMLGLSRATRVALIANAADYTNTKNKSAMMLSERLGLEWTPSAEYVDLYIDGEYMGVYLASDKVECTDDKIKLNPDTDYLVQTTDRTKAGDTLIYTPGWQYFLVDYGKTDGESIENLNMTLNEIEASLSDGQIPEHLDMESFAKKYFLEQIVCNTDVHSWYFYLKSGQLYSGPVWDYDLAAHYLPCYETVFAHKRFLWYEKVLQNKAMKDYLAEYYNSKVLDEAEAFLGDVIELEDSLRKSNEMNLLRWDPYVDLDKLCKELNDNYSRHLKYITDTYQNTFDGHILRIVIDGGDLDYLYFTDSNGVLSLTDDCPLLKGAKGIKVSDGSEFDYTVPMTEDVSIHCLE